MKNTVILIFFCLISIFSNAQSYSGPESVEYDQVNSRWLISNTTSHQVLARDSNGVLTVFTTLTGTGPYGIEITGDTLYCCNGASVKGFLLSNAQQVFSVTTPATFLNGITHDNSGNLIVTDFTGKAIYGINISSQAVTPMATAMNTTPNGIIFDAANNRCVYVNWGSNAPVKAIDMSSNAISTLTTTTMGSCDGIARDGAGNYYVSTWSMSSVMKFDSSFSAAPVTVATGLSNPADIFYSTVLDTLAIPNSGNSTVTFIGFSTVGIERNNFENLEYALTGNAIRFNQKINLSVFNIFDINGSLKIEGTLNNQDYIPLDKLSSGVYLLNIRSDRYIFTRKFILTK
jgi:hypothetical protein